MKSTLQFACAAFLVFSGCAREVRVPEPPPLDFVFEAEPATIAPGESTTLHWNIPGADKVLIESAGLSDRRDLRPLGTFAGAGKVEVSPTADTTYVITCQSGKTVTCASTSVRVRVLK